MSLPVARTSGLSWLTRRAVAVTLGALVPLLVTLTLIPLRDAMLNANVALVLVAVVVSVAVLGGREAAVSAAVVSALAFDFFHTQPYQHLHIASDDDVGTTLLLLVVGLSVGHVATSGRRARMSAREREREITRIYRVANLAARGEDAADVMMATQAELVALLHLENCRFEAPPFRSALERLDRSGSVSWREYHVGDGGLELPSGGVELSVEGRGQLLGRFVLDPTPGVGVSMHQRIVAVALADQVGAVLAAHTPGADARGC